MAAVLMIHRVGLPHDTMDPRWGLKRFGIDLFFCSFRQRMELDRFSRIFRNAEIGSKPGLYVVKQDGLPGRYKRVYRCGAAGIRSSGDGLGTLASRMRTYHDSRRRLLLPCEP